MSNQEPSVEQNESDDDKSVEDDKYLELEELYFKGRKCKNRRRKTVTGMYTTKHIRNQIKLLGISQ